MALANGGHEVVEVTSNYTAAVDMKTIKNEANVLARQTNANPKTVSPILNHSRSANAPDNAKLPDMGSRKNTFRSSASFFDR